MDRRARTTLILAVVAQAAVSVVQFGLPAIGLEVRDKFDLGPAGFGAVFAADGLGSAVALIPTGILAAWFAALSPAGGGESRGLRLDGALTAPGMRPLLVVALLYVFSLAATLTYIVPAARDAGLDRAGAGALFVVVNLAAGASRLFWGRIADRGSGTRRARTIAECGLVAACSALILPLALGSGLVGAILVT